MAARNPLTHDDDGDVAVHRTSAWSQRIAAHVADLQGQINRVACQGPTAPDAEYVKKADTHLGAARQALRRRGAWDRVRGKSTDTVLANLHEAEVAVLRLVPEAELRWKGLPVLVQARLHLDPEDARLQHLEEVLSRSGAQVAGADRELLAQALHAAYQAEEAERARVRYFTRLLCAATLIMALIAVGFALWALSEPAVGTRFCFPEDADDPNAKPTICPFGKDPSWQGVWFVEFCGMLGAAVAGSVSLRKVRGSSGPYHVATALLLLRLPVGALTAVIGILLLSGRFFPGLTALDTSTQIIAWAIAFGVLQESVTRAVDRQGQFLLENVRTPGREPGGDAGRKERSGRKPPKPSGAPPAQRPGRRVLPRVPGRGTRKAATPPGQPPSPQ